MSAATIRACLGAITSKLPGNARDMAVHEPGGVAILRHELSQRHMHRAAI